MESGKTSVELKNAGLTYAAVQQQLSSEDEKDEETKQETPSVNDSNREFYQQLFQSPQGLAPYIKNAGLDSNCDLELIKANGYLPFDLDTPILIIGAGSGRELSYLLENGYRNLTAVEREEEGAQQLASKFSSAITGQYLKIVNIDFKAYEPLEKFQLALWLWCGFNDFGASEQPEMIHKATSLLEDGGRLIIDSADPSSLTNVNPVASDSQHSTQEISHTFNFDGKTYSSKIPTRECLVAMINETPEIAEFNLIEYSPVRERNRFLVALTRQLNIDDKPSNVGLSLSSRAF